MRFSEEFRKGSKRAAFCFVVFTIFGVLLDRLFGFFLIVTGLSLASVAGRTLKVYGRKGDIPRGTTNVLVTKGVFSVVRHPAFDGFIMLLFGIALAFKSIGLLISAALSSAYIVYFALKVEERENEERFGDAYRRYKERVPPFIPRLFR